MHNAQADFVQTAVQQGVALQKAGRIDAAERLYRRVLETCPEHAEANHNLGIINMQRGKLSEGVAHFKRALDADGERELYQRSYARALALCGAESEPRGAVVVEGEAARRVKQADEFLRRGNVLTAAGKFLEAIECFQQAVVLNRELAVAYHHLGSLLAETGRVAEGFANFMERARLVGGATPEVSSEPLHKSSHDEEQRAYLLAQGRIVPSQLGPAFYIGDGARIAGTALNRRCLTPEVLRRWQEGDSRVVVIDDFLTQAALQNLRRYCAESTVWRRVYQAGYIGATPADGFACPLLAQITEEISEVYAEILGHSLFQYLGAFKYDSKLSTGTNIHADFAAINLNLYMAPDEANLDPETGGMVIWNLAARDERQLRYYNGNDRAIRDHLALSGASATRVAHRANRAVFFDSRLFHKTDECHFKEGYLNKRINVSFLFGRFTSPEVMRDDVTYEPPEAQ